MNRFITLGITLLAMAACLGGFASMGLGDPPAPILGAGTSADPVQIPYAKGPLKINADPSDWAAVAFLPEPFMKKAPGSVKMCWNENGLYLLAVVKDKTPTPELANPWEGDCLELFIEKDAARAEETSANTVQFCVAPTPDMGEGKCSLAVPQGDKTTAGKIASAWKKTADGYIIEMLIPAATLAPAKLVPGTKLSLNYALDDNGKPVEQFFSDKNAEAGYKTPSSWAAIILK